jgi:hypothetical protein
MYTSNIVETKVQMVTMMPNDVSLFLPRARSLKSNLIQI